MSRSFPILTTVLLFASSCGGPQGAASDGSRQHVDAGGPLGDVGPAPTTLTLTAPYTIPAGSEVTYECYSTTVHFAGTAYINSFTPHTPSGTHHMVVFIDHAPSQPDGMAPCGFTAGTSQTVIYAAGIGANATVFPTGVGYPLHDGDQLILQLHELNASCSPIGATASLDIGFATGTSIIPAQVSLIGNVLFTIPKGAAGYSVTGQCSSLPAGTNVFAVFPHMHQIGTSIQVTLDTTSGTQTLADVNPWSFTEQPVINVAPAAQVAAGGVETVTCTYDNTTGAAVKFGQSSKDEMCFGITYFYPASSAVPSICAF